MLLLKKNQLLIWRCTSFWQTLTYKTWEVDLKELNLSLNWVYLLLLVSVKRILIVFFLIVPKRSFYLWVNNFKLLYQRVSINLECVHSSECLQWTSNFDGKYRSHCYECHHGTPKSTFEAETVCKSTGGQLAPYLDEFQYDFWKGFLPSFKYSIYMYIISLTKIVTLIIQMLDRGLDDGGHF